MADSQRAGTEGSVPAGHRPGPRGTTRALIAVLATLLIAGLFGEVLRRSWADAGREATITATERQGVVFEHTMIGLIGALVETQSTAVRGDPVDAEMVRRNLAAAALADSRVGGPLGAHQRFADLRTRVEAALGTPGRGRAAYQTYTDLVALTVDLATQVGDTSRLVHDQDLDSFYVMEAALIQLPDAIVNAGRTSDLVTLAGDQQLTGDDAIRAAVARHDVASAGEAVTDGINKSVNNTSRPALGTDIAPLLDTFRAAIDAFAPPTMLAQLAGTVDAKDLAAGAHQVFEAAVPLAHKLLSELDALLSARQATITGQRRFLAEAAAGGALAALILLVAVARRNRRPAVPPPPVPAPMVQPDQPLALVVPGSRGAR